jgi:hypothetical protein
MANIVHASAFFWSDRREVHKGLALANVPPLIRPWYLQNTSRKLRHFMYLFLARHSVQKRLRSEHSFKIKILKLLKETFSTVYSPEVGIKIMLICTLVKINVSSNRSAFPVFRGMLYFSFAFVMLKGRLGKEVVGP